MVDGEIREEALPVGMAGRAFAVRDALVAGVPASRLRRRDLAVPFRGARTPADSVDDFRMRCRALSARNPEAVISHHSAARLLGLPSIAPNAERDDMHITVEAPSRPPRIAGVRAHGRPLPKGEVMTAYGIPVTSPARTWADLAPTSSVRELVVLGDAIIHWRRPLASLNELKERACGRGRRGAIAARSAPALVHQRSESPQESLLRVILTEAGIPPPEVNIELFSPGGRFLARPDLRYPEQRVILEYEGDHHRVERKQWNTDLLRTTRLQDAGETVLRLGATHLRNEKPLVALVYTTLASRGWAPSN